MSELTNLETIEMLVENHEEMEVAKALLEQERC